MEIAIYAFDGITMFHLATPLLAFGEVSRQRVADEWNTSVWSDGEGRICSSEGLGIDGVVGPQAAEDADLLIFPSWPISFPHPSESIVSTIRHAHERGAVVAGLCLGAFPVVASGILDGRSAATHWNAASTLAERYPAVEVQPDALYVDHGDVITSAGTASGLDACLHLIRRQLGSDAASTVARHLVVAPHREGGQAQYVERPLPATKHGPIGEAVDWVLGHLDERMSIEDLAVRASMSPRNFTRRFREVMGISPAKWVLARRLDEACRLLEVTDWGIERVAAASGFSSAVTFRQNFVSRYSTTPTSYRRRFAAVE